jgi:transposase
MKTIAERVRKHRANLRKAGLKPIQIWVPDTKKKGFAAEARRQSRLVASDPKEKEILEWIEKTADLSGWQWDGDL